MKKIALLVFVLSLHLTNYAQVSVDGTPPSFTQTLGTTISTHHLPAVNVQKLLAEDDADQKLDKSQPWRFGKDFEVRLGLSNAGTWETLSNGDRVWRFKIKSKDAKSLNFIFDEFYMPTGAEFYIYNEDKSYVIGAFTALNNKSHGQFSTAPVKGSTVIMEYYEPQAVIGLGKITVSSIIYAYRDLFTHAQNMATKGYGDSGSCNIDVTCPAAAGWENEIKSVALIMTSGGTRICSGAMVNNTQEDQTPYFLTANHCLGGNSNTWVFAFNYDSPSCNGPDGSLSTSISGSVLRANYGPSDFALLELSTIPPQSYNVFYAGWTRSTTAATSCTGIHHPAGDVKKISHSDDALFLGSVFSTTNHWRVDDWEQGTTEGGSSGSPLFDQNHHIVGQLHGGAASCTVIDYDEYGKFDVSWNGGGTSTTSLQPWLDPSNTTVTLDGNGFSCGASSLAAIVTDTSATLTWNATIDTITNFVIQFRADGDTAWITYNISDTILSHDVFNLMPCTDYEFRIDMYCDSVWSGFSNIFEFTTDGCCNPPSNLIATNTSDSTATLSGDPVLIALSYDMRYREVGASTWTTVSGLTNVSYNLTNLNFCTGYEVEWRTICPSDTTTWAGITFTTSCGNCLDLPYCASTSNNVSDEWIEEVIINTISNNSGIATVGYSDFTHISTTLQQGVTYPISVSQGYSGTIYTEHFSIWIDFNQDGIFDASEQVYASGATTTSPNTGTIIIPVTATLGSTRMRVSMQYDTPPPTCGNYTWGEVEDYCVDIIPAGAFCATPGGLSATNETTSSADISWSAVSSVIGYNVRYREVGTSTWTNTTSATNSMTLTGLADCADFEFEVEADCDTIGTSGYSSALTFTTICICDAITDLDTVVINSNDVTIDWTPTNNNQSYSVEYRIMNSPNWSNIPTTGNTYQMTSLAPGTLYEVRLRATCTDGTQSPYSNTLLFRTDWIVSANSLPLDVTSLSVFPNPTSAHLNLLVDLTKQQDVSIEVFNVAGQVLKNQMTTLSSGENTVSIDLENFTSGVYFIRLTTENGVATRRVIKN